MRTCMLLFSLLIWKAENRFLLVKLLPRVLLLGMASQGDAPVVTCRFRGMDTYKARTWETEAEWSVRIQGQYRLQSETCIKRRTRVLDSSWRKQHSDLVRARRGSGCVVVTAAITEDPGTGENAGQDLHLGLSGRDTCKDETDLLALTRKPAEPHRAKKKC